MLEYGIDQKNGFAKTFIPYLNDSIKRNSIPIKDIRIIQKECLKIIKKKGRIIALGGGTFMNERIRKNIMNKLSKFLSRCRYSRKDKKLFRLIR